MLFSILIFGVFTKLTNSQQVVKCCPQNQALDLTQYQCKDADQILPNRLLDSFQSTNLSLKTNNSHFPQCGANEIFINRPISQFYRDQKLLNKFTQLCADITINDKIVFVGCLSYKNRENLPGKKTLLRKCCPWTEHVMPGTPCEPSSLIFKPDFIDASNTSVALDIYADDTDIITPGCSDKYIPEEDDEHIYLLKNGSVWFPSGKEQTIFNTEEFCLDNTPYHDSTQIFLCFKTIENAASLEHWISGIGIVISIAFLIVTFIVYSMDKKKRHLYGQTLMCHIVSFTIAFTCLVAAKIFPEPENDIVNEFIAYIMYFSFLAGFFWQNVMCIDLWRTFRAIRSRDCHSRGNKVLRFLSYSAYAWGSSAILTVLVIYMGNTDLLPDDYRPTLYSSWLNRDKYGYYIFFIGPIASIIAVNIVLYIITAKRCYEVKADIGKRMQTNESKRTSRFFQKKEQLSLSAKLFVVMGMTWSLEVISFILRSKLQLSPYIFLLPDIMNSLYGLLIFMIFVIRKEMVISTARFLSSPRAWLCKRNQPGTKYHRGPKSGVQQSTTDSAYSSTHVTDMDTNTL